MDEIKEDLGGYRSDELVRTQLEKEPTPKP